MSDWSTATPAEIIADIQAAMDKVRDEPYHPRTLGPIHPQMHARACDLLGVPHSTALTEPDLWRAASIERERMTPEQREAADAALSRVLASTPYW